MSVSIPLSARLTMPDYRPAPAIPRPWRTETKVPVYGPWFAIVGFDLGDWTLGFAFDVAPTGFGVRMGPLSISAERDEPPPPSYGDLPEWGRTLYRHVVRRWKLDIRLELDLNIWRVGYAMADVHDHGIYLGPLNLQIEYDKLFDEPDSFFFR
jgi:hypothetical protein